MPDFDIRKYLARVEGTSSIAECPPVPLPHIGDGENFIFISYSHRDYDKVYRDLAAMYSAGVRFWYDRGLAAGSNWDDEVERIMNMPGCCGVIFYLSENLFLSASANKEIHFVCPSPERRVKNYFCVNLTDHQPSGILKSALLSAPDGALDMERIAVLANAFGDKQTYLPFSDMNHTERLLEQISGRFDVIRRPSRKSACLELLPEGTRIPIDREAFYIGRNPRKSHCAIADNYVSSLHAAVHERDGVFFLTDMHATNPTVLNGKHLEPDVPVQLKEGDMITFGTHTLIFRLN